MGASCKNAGSAHFIETAYDNPGGIAVGLDPCGLNVLITAVTNQLFTALSKEDFVCLSIFLNELSKSMFATSVFRDLCDHDGKFKR